MSIGNGESRGTNAIYLLKPRSIVHEQAAAVAVVTKSGDEQTPASFSVRHHAIHETFTPSTRGRLSGAMSGGISTSATSIRVGSM